MTAPIDILLATYNGAAYLEAQVDSLLAQTVGSCRIIARDDGSTDGTAELLARLAAAHPARITIVADADRGLGACGNFGRLLTHSTAPYTLFADQDDVWLPDKVGTTLAAMQDAEATSPPGLPILVHTDLRVVDAQLNELAPSFWAYQRLDAERATTLPRLLAGNVVTGCTVMINAALRQRLGPIPEAAVMHDWWLAIAAAAWGRVVPVASATMLYRQHAANRLGAKRVGLAYLLRMLGKVFGDAELTASLRRMEAQAGAFLAQHGANLDPEARATVAACAGLSRQGWVARRSTMRRYGLYKSGLARNIGMWLRL